MSSLSTSSASTLVWLVTGCSQGFGSLFVKEISCRGDKVIATARNTNAIADFEQLPGVKTLQLDVTANKEELDTRIAEAIKIFGRIDVLVNNAGYVLSGVWEELSYEATLAQFNTNFWGAMRMTKAVLPYMRSRKTGTIIFMSSIAAWLGVAAGGPYSASKFALEGAVECLQKEISPLGLKTHLVVLGQFRTSILAAKNRRLDRTEKESDYDSVIESVSARLSTSDNRQPGDPALAIQQIVDAVHHSGAYSKFSELPLRIVLGSDAVAVIRNECNAMLRELAQFEGIARSTDFESSPNAQIGSAIKEH